MRPIEVGTTQVVKLSGEDAMPLGHAECVVVGYRNGVYALHFPKHAYLHWPAGGNLERYMREQWPGLVPGSFRVCYADSLAKCLVRK